MQGLLIETRNDLPATFHSTLIPRHFSELTLTARLHENLSLFTDTLFASDIFFSTPLPLFFQLFGIDHTITDGGGHCSILPRCPKVYTNKGTREIVSQPFHPTDSRKSSSKPRRKREAERERERLILSVARRTRSEWENERKSRGRLFRLFEDARSGRGWVGNGEDLSNRVAWRVYILRSCVPGAYATCPPKARRCNDAGHYY